VAYYEIVMAKAFEALVDPDTKVDVSAGMVAATRLQALLDSHTQQPDLAELRRRVDRIGEAVRTTVPRSMWADIVAKLDDYEQFSRDTYDDNDEFPEACEPDDFDGSSDDY
jgi:hypothetical protein